MQIGIIQVNKELIEEHSVNRADNTKTQSAAL